MKVSRYRYLFLLLLLLGVSAFVFKSRRIPEVRVSVVRRTTLSADLSATGFVEAPEVTISSKVTGRVAQVRVDEGDTVRRGDVLLVIENQESKAMLKAARGGESAASSHAEAVGNEVAAAREEAPAQVGQAQAAVAEAEAQLSRLRHGSRPEEIREAHATLDQAREGVRLAGAQLAASQTALDQQQRLSQAQIRQAEAVLAAARAAEEQVQSGLRPQEKSQAEAALREAKSRRVLAEKEYQRISSLHTSGAVSKQQLDQAEAAYEVSRETEAQAQERLSLAQEGSRQEERAVSKAQTEAAEARLNEARAAADQVQVRRREVEAAQAQVAQAEASLRATAARVKLVEEGARPEDIAAARARALQARAALRQARASLSHVSAKASERRAAQAQSLQAAAQGEQASIQLKETVIRSPLDGVVSRRLIDAGELVVPSSPLLPGTELMRLVDPTKRWVMTEVEAEDLGKVRSGQKVEVTAEGYPGRAFPGTISWVGATAEPKPGGRTRARIVRAKVSLLTAAAELKPGLEVDVSARATLSETSLLVPNDALLHNGEGESYVFTVRDNRVSRRVLKTGKRNDLTSEVLSGVSEGERVVVRGKEGLRKGMRVEVVN